MSLDFYQGKCQAEFRKYRLVLYVALAMLPDPVDPSVLRDGYDGSKAGSSSSSLSGRLSSSQENGDW